MSDVVRRLVVVRGRVQGVGFRASCAGRASRLGLAGWVRNQPDGTVQALCVGPEEAVAALVDWCRDGPPLARVTDVSVTDVSVTDVSVTDVSGTDVAGTDVAGLGSDDPGPWAVVEVVAGDPFTVR